MQDASHPTDTVRTMRQEAEPQAVFVFYEDGSGVDAFASLPDLAAELEAIDVRNGEYTFFTADGRVIRGVVNGGAARDFELHVTQEDAADLLRQRLETALPRIGIDAALATSPLSAAQALIDAQWAVRWPRKPTWLDRRPHGSKPVVDDGLPP